MKKLDRLVLGSYFGPFLITLPVITFIFLVQTILKYIDELVGKDIGFASFLELIFYFSLNLVPMAMPLAVLLGSLIAFGNMGEHNELTAIKSSGISLVRIFRPVFVFVVILTAFMFWFNDKVVPKINLKAYSLLYDLRHKKPALDIKEGSFYNGLPGYSIKVGHKYPDGKTLKDIIIYNHSDNRGNTQVIVADSGKMETVFNEKYLSIELYKGHDYSEQIDKNSNTLHPKKFVRTHFLKSRIIFDLNSFALKPTDEGLFKGNKIMRDIPELVKDMDSIDLATDSMIVNFQTGVSSLYFFTVKKGEEPLPNISPEADTFKLATMLKYYDKERRIEVINLAANHCRTLKAYINGQTSRLDWLKRERRLYEIELHQKFTKVLVCLLFFIIGAPLGAIIKKGGLGMPMLICLIFFVIYYIISMTSEKWVKENYDSEVWLGMWCPLFILLPFGLFFLRQARNDSKVFDTDIYIIYWGRFKNYIEKKRRKKL